jgi:hypothetical protein
VFGDAEWSGLWQVEEVEWESRVDRGAMEAVYLEDSLAMK